MRFGGILLCFSVNRCPCLLSHLRGSSSMVECLLPKQKVAGSIPVYRSSAKANRDPHFLLQLTTNRRRHLTNTFKSPLSSIGRAMVS